MINLKARLEADRAELVEMLRQTPPDRHLECGLVRMLADVQTAIGAVEAVPMMSNAVKEFYAAG